MARVSFTANLERHVRTTTGDYAGATVREVLDQVFSSHQLLRDYVVDEHGALRKHMLVFVNGQRIADRMNLSDPVPPGGEVYVAQALSGG